MRTRQVAAVLAVVAVAALAGCTSTVSGRGRAAGPETSSAPSASSPSTGGSGSTPSPSSRVGPYARTPASTAIDDPATADLCAAIGLTTLGGLGLSAVYDPAQYPPGCGIELQRDGRTQVSLSVYATVDAPDQSAGRTSRTESGLTVLAYPFQKIGGDCERDIAATGVTFKVSANSPTSSETPDRTINCGGTDAMTSDLAAAVSQHAVPRLKLASPSVTSLNFCSVAGASHLETLSAFAGGALSEQAYGVSCEVKPASGVFLFFNTVIDSSTTPQQSRITFIGGHQVFESTNNGKGFCSFVSVQGSVSGGGHEEISASAAAASADHVPAGLCDETGRALAMFLDTAGLR